MYSEHNNIIGLYAYDCWIQLMTGKYVIKIILVNSFTVSSLSFSLELKYI